MTRHTLPVRWHSAYCCALLAAADICWIAVGACAAGSMPCALCFCRLRQQWHCLCIQVLSWENGNFEERGCSVDFATAEYVHNRRRVFA